MSELAPASDVTVVAGTILLGALLLVLMSMMRAIGEEAGRAILAQSAPWVALSVARVMVRVVFLRRLGSLNRRSRAARDKLLKEVEDIVQALFAERTSVSERTWGVIQVWVQTASMIRTASSHRALASELEKVHERGVRRPTQALQPAHIADIKRLKLPRAVESEILGHVRHYNYYRTFYANSIIVDITVEQPNPIEDVYRVVLLSDDKDLQKIGQMTVGVLSADGSITATSQR